MHLAIEDESGDDMDENTEPTELECITGPAVTVRIMPETGPSVTVEWAEKPTPGEVVLLAEVLVKALRPRAAGGPVGLGRPYLVGERPGYDGGPDGG